MKEIQKPNFFIIGAPKCGTSALAEYLREHPDIFFSHPKEPGYFLEDDFGAARRIVKEDQYLKLFEGAKGYTAVGEGSVSYLYSQQAVPNILKFNPRARFIIMLRNPIDMFRSLYEMSKFGSAESAKTLEEAWRLQGERRKNPPTFPPLVHVAPQMLQYGPLCKLGEQVERLYSHISREKVLVLFAEDLRDNTGKVYRRTLEFLGVPDDNRREFPRHNKAKVSPIPHLPYVLYLIAEAKRRLGIKKGIGLIGLVERIATKQRDKLPELSVEFKKELMDYFRSDVEKLQKLCGRDLSHWLS